MRPATRFVLSILLFIVAWFGLRHIYDGWVWTFRSMGEPWQCELDPPPMSCYGNLEIQAYFSLYLYIGTAIGLPTVVGAWLILGLRKHFALLSE